MSTDTLSALRKAASVLLEAAPLPVVQAALRTLLEGTEIAERPIVRSPSHHSAAPKQTTSKPSPSPGWLALRRRVRAEMAKRGMDAAALAAELGMARITIYNSLGRLTPSSQALVHKLTDWLEAMPAPAVAGSAAPFRRSGPGRLRTGNGVGAGARAGVSEPAGTASTTAIPGT